jgi:redox-sensing transcriptional repressor
MEPTKMMETERIPERTLRRLPWYLAYLKLAADQGENFISSTQIARAINVSASQIAKDLSLLNVSGNTRVGYDVKSLIEVLEDFLGFRQTRQAYLFGVGNLGGALLHDKGLSQYGLEIVAGFDVNPAVIGQTINGIPVYHIDEYPAMRTTSSICIGILTVPVEKAQAVAECMVAGGIKAVWNFTPFRIHMPENIVVQNTSIYAHMALIFNRLERR